MICETCKRVNTCPLFRDHEAKIQKVRDYTDFIFRQDSYKSKDEMAESLGIDISAVRPGEVLSISCMMEIAINDCMFFEEPKKCPHCGLEID